MDLVDGGGFEPPKAKLADLQSAPFGHSGTRPYYLILVLEPAFRKPVWSWRWDLNPQPTDYKSVALPIELLQQYGASGRN